MVNKQALIIEDDVLNANVLKLLLEKEGVSSLIAKSYIVLPDVLSQLESVNVVFLDLRMPEVDGFAVFANLKAYPLLGSTPIIGYSVNVSEITRARQIGFDGFLGKPINTHRFSRNLARIFNGEPVWDIGI